MINQMRNKVAAVRNIYLTDNSQINKRNSKTLKTVMMMTGIA